MRLCPKEKNERQEEKRRKGYREGVREGGREGRRGKVLLAPPFPVEETDYYYKLI